MHPEIEVVDELVSRCVKVEGNKPQVDYSAIGGHLRMALDGYRDEIRNADYYSNNDNKQDGKLGSSQATQVNSMVRELDKNIAKYCQRDSQPY